MTVFKLYIVVVLARTRKLSQWMTPLFHFTCTSYSETHSILQTDRRTCSKAEMMHGVNIKKLNTFFTCFSDSHFIMRTS